MRLSPTLFQLYINVDHSLYYFISSYNLCTSLCFFVQLIFIQGKGWLLANQSYAFPLKPSFLDHYQKYTETITIKCKNVNTTKSVNHNFRLCTELTNVNQISYVFRQTAQKVLNHVQNMFWR